MSIELAVAKTLSGQNLFWKVEMPSLFIRFHAQSELRSQQWNFARIGKNNSKNTAQKQGLDKIWLFLVFLKKIYCFIIAGMCETLMSMWYEVVLPWTEIFYSVLLVLLCAVGFSFWLHNHAESPRLISHCDDQFLARSLPQWILDTMFQKLIISEPY